MIFGRRGRSAVATTLVGAVRWPPHRIWIAGHLAGNEAETQLFGLDRLALRCRPDGSVPIAPGQRLADADRLATIGASLDPDGWFAGLSLALVRLAQLRRAEAAELIRPHVADGGEAWVAQARTLLAVWTAVCGLLMAVGRLAPSEARQNLRAGQEQAWQRFQQLRRGSDEDAVAAISAPLAAMAWGDRARAYQAVPIASHLAGNEAETHLFGLDRLAFCCRADGSVPIDPAERLAAAEALALRGATRACPRRATRFSR